MSFWTAAISAGVSGLGVVGCYVFWSLMKRLAPTVVGHPLNQKQTFQLAIFCIAVVFLSLLAILTAGYFYLTHHSPGDTFAVLNTIVGKREQIPTPLASDLGLARRQIYRPGTVGQVRSTDTGAAVEDHNPSDPIVGRGEWVRQFGCSVRPGTDMKSKGAHVELDVTVFDSQRPIQYTYKYNGVVGNTWTPHRVDWQHITRDRAFEVLIRTPNQETDGMKVVVELAITGESRTLVLESNEMELKYPTTSVIGKLHYAYSRLE
jgi:hypothetical protein